MLYYIISWLYSLYDSPRVLLDVSIKFFDSWADFHRLFQREGASTDSTRSSSWFYLKSSPVERLFDVLRNLVANIDATMRHISRGREFHGAPDPINLRFARQVPRFYSTIITSETDNNDFVNDFPTLRMGPAYTRHAWCSVNFTERSWKRSSIDSKNSEERGKKQKEKIDQPILRFTQREARHQLRAEDLRQWN